MYKCLMDAITKHTTSMHTDTQVLDHLVLKFQYHNFLFGTSPISYMHKDVIGKPLSLHHHYVDE